MLYPQTVMLRDLGDPLTAEQLALVSSAAVSACDFQVTGEHDGFISEIAACHYDPTRDITVLCATDGGINISSACVTRREANVVNKIWYGPTVDGSVPSPAVETGYATSLRPGQVHFGFTRGTILAGLSPLVVAGSFLGEPTPISLATSLTALILEDPAIASPDSWIPRESAKNGWKSLGYADFVELDLRATQLNDRVNDLEARKPDLTQYAARHGKIIQYHGTMDTVLPIQGSNMYYEAVAQTMGSYATVQDFYRYFPVPGFGHCLGVGSSDGRTSVSPPADPPLPQLVPDNEFYLKLIDWVEGNHAPDNVVVSSSTGVMQRPLCAYPKQLKFSGGDPLDANRYTCK
jgi:feruloyl esterase